MPYKPKEREYRSAAPFTVPDTAPAEGESLILRGMPIVFDTPTVLFEEDGIEYKEVIDRRALDECDMSDFIFNVNHGYADPTVFARNKNGSIKFEITPAGVPIEVFLDSEDERHRNLYRDIQKRRLDKMSFSFSIREFAYERETHTRTVLKIKKLYDVSAVDFAAYNDTSITTARGFFAEEHAKEFKELEERRRRQMLIALSLT